MSYLLDTHILLWLRFSPEKLTEIQRIALTSSEEEKFISSLSAWEISLKFSLGKLDLGGHTPEEFMAGLYALGIPLHRNNMRHIIYCQKLTATETPLTE
jgi:PIN domain nuclease of toxin-antitoxin system